MVILDILCECLVHSLWEHIESHGKSEHIGAEKELESSSKVLQRQLYIAMVVQTLARKKPQNKISRLLLEANFRDSSQ